MGEARKRGVAVKYDALGGRIYDLRYTEEQGAKYEALLERITPGTEDIALDIGCGTGLLTEQLESQAVGLDISASLLSTARSRLRGRARSYLIMGDARVLPFRDSSFDVVFSVTVIQNTPDPLSSIEEMKRVGRARAGVTALKKAFTRESFEALLREARLTSIKVLDSSGLNDWVVLIDL
ncbi:class I SAM-dependent methyltransferase [Candidatus Bathyarchaeota archaeon]|nr:class I SAM-dependent methyltransferase [Candidatus Bathyarchaeota archaeon]